MSGLLLVLVAVAFATVGDVVGKAWATRPSVVALCAVVVTWAVSCGFWLYAFRKLDLGVSVTFGTAVQLVANVIAGMLLFRERLGTLGWIGVGSAVVAVLAVAADEVRSR